MEEIEKRFLAFRLKLRNILNDAGFRSNPGWTEADIISAYREIVIENELLRRKIRDALGHSQCFCERCSDTSLKFYYAPPEVELPKQ